MCRRDAVKLIYVRHIATSQSASDVRDVGPAIAQYRMGFNVLEWPVLKIKFQIASNAHLT
jgi:hypothetical protein